MPGVDGWWEMNGMDDNVLNKYTHECLGWMANMKWKK